MRIAFFVKKFPNISETFILNKITGLMDLGHDLVVLAESRPDDEPVHDMVREYGLRERAVYLDGLGNGPVRGTDLADVARLAARTPRALGNLSRERAASFGGRLVVLRRMAALSGAGPRPDIIHCHFGDVGLRWRVVTRLWNAPLVVSFYGHDCSRLPEMRGGDVYEPLFSVADLVTVLSGQMRKRLVSLGCPEERIREHHIGVDPERFPFRERGEEVGGRPVRLLTVARLVEKKGVEFALRAVERVATAGADVRYVVIGDGPLRPTLEALADSLGIASRTEFRGSVPQGAVRRAMGEADLFLLPSVTASDGDQEGTPTVVMEASACGLPVVSTWHAGIPEVVRDGVTGVLVSERDAGALAEALTGLLSSPERWAEMGRAGREHIQRRYNVRTLVGSLEGLYGELLASVSPSASGTSSSR